MIDLYFSLLCKRIVIDKETNSIDIQNVIEQLTIFGDPPPNGVLPIDLCFFALWSRSDVEVPASGEMRLSLILPGEDAKEIITVPVDLEKHQRRRNIIKFQKLTVTKSGRYIFLLELKTNDDWKEVSKTPLDVTFSPMKEFKTEIDE